MINKWIIMGYLEYLLLTYCRYWMYLSLLSFCKTKFLQLVTFCLKRIQDYLQNQKDWVIFSIWRILLLESQGFILGPLLINVFICDISLECGNNYFANYADNTKIRIVDENTKEVLNNLSPLANSNIHMAC